MSYYGYDAPRPTTTTMPELSPTEIANAKGTFLQAIARGLTIRGDDSPENIKALMGMSEDVRVTSRSSGPEVMFADGNVRLRADAAADYLAQNWRTRAALLKHGPDPVEVLSARLQRLGVEKQIAEHHAAAAIVRLPDGRVARLDEDTGTPVHLPIKEKSDSDTFSPEQWEAYRDGTEQLTRATQQALGKIERSAQSMQRVQSRQSHADAVRAAF